MEDVDEKRIVLVSYFGLIVAELNQSRFAHASRRDDYQVVSIGDGFDEPRRFRHAITEILRFDPASYNKRVHIYVIVYTNIIIQIE